MIFKVCFNLKVYKKKNLKSYHDSQGVFLQKTRILDAFIYNSFIKKHLSYFSIANCVPTTIFNSIKFEKLNKFKNIFVLKYHNIFTNDFFFKYILTFFFYNIISLFFEFVGIVLCHTLNFSARALTN